MTSPISNKTSEWWKRVKVWRTILIMILFSSFQVHLSKIIDVQNFCHSNTMDMQLNNEELFHFQQAWNDFQPFEAWAYNVLSSMNNYMRWNNILVSRWIHLTSSDKDHFVSMLKLMYMVKYSAKDFEILLTQMLQNCIWF